MVLRSRSSGPAMTSSIRAASRTVRVIGPMWESDSAALGGNWGTRPKDGLWPKMPQNDDGMRIEPAPSLPWASGPRPAATAAPAPPLEPPAVRAGFQGLRLGGKRRVLGTPL